MWGPNISSIIYDIYFVSTYVSFINSAIGTAYIVSTLSAALRVPEIFFPAFLQ